MAEVTETRVLPPEFIEAAGKTYLGDLATATGQYKGAGLSKVFGQQFELVKILYKHKHKL